MKRSRIKKGDQVRVIAGDHKGQEGQVLEILVNKGKAIVEEVNMISKHQKPSATNPQGGITKKEAPIHISNLSLITKDGQTTRLGSKIEDGKKVRVAKKTNEAI
jgi:large subunit ribosomal protein L24